MHTTTWTEDTVTAVLQGEIAIDGLQREPYAVNDHGITGGPVLRGPWGSVGLMNSEPNWIRLGDECRRLNIAHVHGYLVAARQVCSVIGCAVRNGRCSRCGGEEPTVTETERA